MQKSGTVLTYGFLLEKPSNPSELWGWDTEWRLWAEICATETEFESFIFDSEFLNLNDCKTKPD